MDGGAWWAAVHEVAKSWTGLSDFTFTSHFHALEKEMATHSSVLAWRIPGTGEPGGLPSIGSHRVWYNWSDITAAAAAAALVEHHVYGIIWKCWLTFNILHMDSSLLIEVNILLHTRQLKFPAYTKVDSFLSPLFCSYFLFPEWYMEKERLVNDPWVEKLKREIIRGHLGYWFIRIKEDGSYALSIYVWGKWYSARS